LRETNALAYFEPFGGDGEKPFFNQFCTVRRQIFGRSLSPSGDNGCVDGPLPDDVEDGPTDGGEVKGVEHSESPEAGLIKLFGM
jgi:hypothetical protein